MILKTAPSVVARWLLLAVESKCTSRSKMTSRAGAAASALLLLLYLGSICGEYTSQGLSTFVDTMLAEYDREVPPQARTVVQLALDVRHATVDDASATMRLLADLKMSWNDSRVSWNASLWEGNSVLVSAERLWSPDVALVNAGGGGDSGAELRARLTAAGGVSAVRRLLLSVPVALRLADWPQDVQEAVFKFATRDLGEDEIDIVISDTKHSVVVESGAWEVVSVVGWSWLRGGDVESGEDKAQGAAWRVRAARRASAHAHAAGAVLAATALLLVAAAALPYQQRAPLAACAAFLAAAWLVSAAGRVPAGAAPRVLRVLCAACACAAASGACAAAACSLARRAAPPPAALRALLSRTSALYTLMPEPESARDSKSGAWVAAAQLFDNVVVFAMLLTLLVLVGVHLFS